MCNGHHHPIDCTCGWGGDGHLGRRTDGNDLSIVHSGLFNKRNYQSYTIPNTKCPVCGAPVYFYKSENGGSVYFDDLGPPWPKHLCTDSGKYSRFIPAIELTYISSYRQWTQEGWSPVLIQSIPRKSSYAFTIERVNKFSQSLLEVMLYGSNADIFMANDALIYFKRLDTNTFELVAYDIRNDVKIQLHFKHDVEKLDKFCEFVGGTFLK